MIPAPLSLAKSDPRLRGAPLAVYVWCLEHLDTLEYRPVKILVLSAGVRIKTNTAVDALRRLCDAGYLSKGVRPKGEARRYRVLASPVAQGSGVKAKAA